MNDLKIKSCSAKNFLCFGPEGIDFVFDAMGNIVLIRGVNLDIDPDNEEERKASNGTGKCFGKNTPILMYDGNIKMVQNIKENDLVMGPDSKPRKVTGLSHGISNLFRIMPKKGASFVVNENHILALKTCGENGCNVNIKIKDYIALPNWKKRLLMGFRAELNFNKKKVFINPYVLGIWLGDGSSHTAAITNMHKKLIDAWKNEAKKRNLLIVKQTKSNDSRASTFTMSNKRRLIVGKKEKLAYELKVKHKQINQLCVKEFNSCLNGNYCAASIYRWAKKYEKHSNCFVEHLNANHPNSFLNDLNNLNLINNKHIPLVYLTNSKENRLQLLAGIIDTDGYACQGCYYIIQKNYRLACDIEFLAKSLGFGTSFKPVTKKCQTGKSNIYYKVSIFGDKKIPVRINYKKTSRCINKNPLNFGFSVKEIEKGEFFGFSVDKDHLFLLGDCTVVHNSSVAEIVVYTLFGKTIKHPSKIKQENIINNQANKKNLETEVLFGDYRVIRRRGPDSLRIWKSNEGIWNKDTELSNGGIPANQRRIEEIIGYTYETFSNILVFTDNNMGCFLECTGPQKREIVENLLGLDVYRNYSENASKMRNLAKETIKDKHRTLELTIAEYESSKKRIKTVEEQEKIWKQTKENELNTLVAKFKAKQAELGNTNIGPALAKYQETQENISIFQNDLPNKEEKLKLIKEAIEEARQKYEVIRKSRDVLSVMVRQINLDVMQIKNVIKINTQMINDLESQRCKNCNFIDVGALERCNKTIETENANLIKCESLLLKESEELTKYDNNINQLVDVIKIGENRSRDLLNDIDGIRKQIINLSKIEKPEITANEKVLEEQLNELKKQLLSKKDEVDGPSPFVKILESTVNESELKQKECEDKKLELDTANNELPYCEFWVGAFGEKGIRKFIIDGIIPALNTRIAHWLQFLIDGKITLTFDDQLNETIHRSPPDGDKFVYYAMSGGERRRLNLAVSQAFAHIMMLNSGFYPSLVFLDEVTTNIDPIGVQGVYNMITELSKERQVFVTTHDQDLLEMLSGCETINLVKQGGFTTIKN